MQLRTLTLRLLRSVHDEEAAAELQQLTLPSG